MKRSSIEVARERLRKLEGAYDKAVGCARRHALMDLICFQKEKLAGLQAKEASKAKGQGQ